MEINQKNYKICEICKVEEAKSLCPQCYCYYCDICFKCVHDRKVNNEHKKEKIDYFVQIDTVCPEHNGIRINLFCLDEKGNNKNLYNDLI